MRAFCRCRGHIELFTGPHRPEKKASNAQANSTGASSAM